MNDWSDYGAVCRELADVYAVPQDEWKDNDPDEVRVKRSIWYMLFEGYESDPSIPPITDAMCLSCPLIKQCFEYGVDNDKTGVHGGVYLLRGKIDASKNSHKTPEDWERLGELLDGQV